MTDRTPAPVPLAGGSLLALSIVIGAVAGMVNGQASIGVLAGAGIGVALLVLVALIDRARNRGSRR